MNKNSFDSNMFESSIEKYSNYMFSLSYRLTGSYEDAQDLFQDTILKAWQNWGNLRNKENPIPWLRRICVNAFIDYTRKSATRRIAKEIVFPDMELEIVSEMPTPEDELLADEEVRLIHSQCFTIITSTLTLNQRIVLVLNDVYKVGILETSFLVNKSYSATKSLLYRAREKMVDNFKPYCSVVNSDNICKCKSWIAFAHDIQKRREYLKYIFSSQIKSKAKIGETKKRIIYLFNNLPLHPPPPLWIDEVLKKIT